MKTCDNSCIFSFFFFFPLQAADVGFERCGQLRGMVLCIGIVTSLPTSSLRSVPMSKILKYLSAEAGLVDVWRNKCPRNRDFTFYSSRHLSYSRIDYIFTPMVESHRIVDIEILPITISHHAPVALAMESCHGFFNTMMIT